jgi:hypothetical protein
MVPEIQTVIYGRTDTLNCSYADNSVNPVTTVEKNEELVVDNEITSATLDDEGEYECDIFLPEYGASIGIPFIVNVIGNYKLAFSLSPPPPPPPLDLFQLHNVLLVLEL